ncbi:30S ribosomal protein S15 [Candidatus Vidania fulgoroideorum]
MNNQIFNLSKKIKKLQAHVKRHNKDLNSLRRLKIKFSKRKRLINYNYKKSTSVVKW